MTMPEAGDDLPPSAPYHYRAQDEPVSPRQHEDRVSIERRIATLETREKILMGAIALALAIGGSLLGTMLRMLIELAK